MIKIKEFRCHMCEQILPATPKMRIGFVGFVWDPCGCDQPGTLLDLCEACQYALLAAWQQAKRIRMDSVYEQCRIEWTREKLDTLREAAGSLNNARIKIGGTPAGTGKAPENDHSPMLNYSKDHCQLPRRYRSHEKQQIWRI